MGYSADMPDNQGGKTIMIAPWPKAVRRRLHDALRPEPGIPDAGGRATRTRDRRPQPAPRRKYPGEQEGEIHLQTRGPDFGRRSGSAPASAQRGNGGSESWLSTAQRHAHGSDRAGRTVPAIGRAHRRRSREGATAQRKSKNSRAEITKVEQKLANPNFTQKVPASVLQEHQQRLVDWQAKLDHARIALALLG